MCFIKIYTDALKLNVFMRLTHNCNILKCFRDSKNQVIMEVYVTEKGVAELRRVSIFKLLSITILASLILLCSC